MEGDYFICNVLNLFILFVCTWKKCPAVCLDLWKLNQVFIKIINKSGNGFDDSIWKVIFMCWK